MDWQLFDTAPKDGRWFFVTGPEVLIPMHCRYDSTTATMVAHPADGVHNMKGKTEVTHWAPMPDSPKSS